MVTKILKRITEFCSLKAPEGTTRNNRKAGFTIIELMVVIVMVNILSGVVVPKCTDLIEKSKEKIDMMKLLQLRDALDRALYEDNVTNVSEGNHGGCKSVNATTLESYLTSNKGLSLFVIQRSSYMPVNYQGTQGQAQSNNMCGLMYTEGFWSTAFREAGFGAVADIIRDRASADKDANVKEDSPTYVAVKNDLNDSWWRTYPRNPIFLSKFLTNDKTQTTASNKSIVLRVRWRNGDPKSHSLDVFFAYDDKDYQSSLKSRWTCFSTLGDAGCKNTR